MNSLTKLERASQRYSRDNGLHNLYYVEYRPENSELFYQIVAVPQDEVESFEAAMCSDKLSQLAKKHHKVLDSGKGSWTAEQITVYDTRSNPGRADLGI